MTDYFALLELPRQPWLDPVEVQNSFLQRSAPWHPDRVHQAAPETKAAAHQRFTELNAARACLRDPTRRLRHLLELELGEPVQALERLPSAAGDFFFELGGLCRAVDQFVAGARGAGATSPLLQARRFEESLTWRSRLEAAQQQLDKAQGELETELRNRLTPVWRSAPAPGASGRRQSLPLDRLLQVYREFSYLSRWSGQIRERLVQLSL